MSYKTITGLVVGSSVAVVGAALAIGSHAKARRTKATTTTKKSATKDPVCGMTVDNATAIHAERHGETFYFCSEGCRQALLSTPIGATA
jgi:YHS domain-containing protein